MDLVINSFGVSVSRDNNGFVITNADGRQRIPVSGITSILIGRGAQITSDAVLLAVENEIEVLFTDRECNPLARVWSPRYGSISTIRKGQLLFTQSKDSVQWIKDVVAKKIENQQALILLLSPSDDARSENLKNSAIQRLEDYGNKLHELQGERVADIASPLRGLEGSASRVYFETINEWMPEEYRFFRRTQHPAMDVANAMLNYGYGLMYGKIEGALIKASIDPYIGVLHRDEFHRPVLVYDVIELYRMWVDYVVFSLLSQRVINDEHYSVAADGSCWLEALGRRIVIQSINDFLQEIVETNGLMRSRLTQIGLYAQDLAQTFKKYK